MRDVHTRYPEAMTNLTDTDTDTDTDTATDRFLASTEGETLRLAANAFTAAARDAGMIPDSNEGALAFFPLAVAQPLSSAKEDAPEVWAAYCDAVTEDARAAYVASASAAVHARP